MFSNKKYKLGRAESVTFQKIDGTEFTRVVRRIIALKRIPFHNVEIGDVGGYVELKSTLSHDHCAWIADNAFVEAGCTVMGNAIFKDGALGLHYTKASGHAVISGKAEVSTSDVRHNSIIAGQASVMNSDISGNTIIDGEAVVKGTSTFGTVHIEDKARILGNTIKKASIILRSVEYGKVSISDSALFRNSTLNAVFVVEGTCEISKDAEIENSHLLGDTVVTDEARVLAGSQIRGTSRITGKSVIPANSNMKDLVIHNQVASYSSTPTLEAPASNKVKLYIESIKEIEAEYESYTTDIVKLIRYPAMADYSIPETHALSMALRVAQRAVKSNDEAEIKESLEKLESVFMLAENTARKVALSYLDSKKKDSLNKAQKCFAIASNEASTENEKKVSFKAGLQSLEGILPVSDDAISLFKKKVGLQEIEA